MSNKNAILKGTLLLTVTGFVSRFIGFFFRMFLSHTFGEENVGLYHLIFPIYALGLSFATAGIQTAISRCAAYKVTLKQEKEARRILYAGLIISLSLSVVTGLLLQINAEWISVHVIGDARCEPLLIVISYAFPFASLHSCICGYYLGLKKTWVPAISQLIEQVVRVLAVYIFYLIALKHNQKIGIFLAVLGLVVGEIFSSMFCFKCFCEKKSLGQFRFPFKKSLPFIKELLTLAIPLTSNRILLNILQSVEAISIPFRLKQYGYTTSEALSTYGVLTGMAIPCILFPSAITNSFSTMLLPTVAEIQASAKTKQLKSLIKTVVFSCFFLGFSCCLIFLFFGRWIGSTLFHSRLAGDFILTLAWICPFLYLNTTLISTINGLGKATTSLLINTSGLLIRILSIILVIPKIGMKGYLWGLLLSQLVVTVAGIVFLIWYIRKSHY